MGYNVVINGFHGTTEDAARKILKNREFSYNNSDNHWLGQGVYFFRDDPEQAMSWALQRVNNEENAVVISTVIDVDTKSFLDLNTRTGILTFDKLLKDIEQKVGFNIEKRSDDENSYNHKLRCMILDLLPNYIKVIQKNFKIKNQPKMITQNLLMQAINIEMYSVQVCVRDTNTIKKHSIRKYKEFSNSTKYKVMKRKKKRKLNFKI